MNNQIHLIKPMNHRIYKLKRSVGWDKTDGPSVAKLEMNHQRAQELAIDLASKNAEEEAKQVQRNQTPASNKPADEGQAGLAGGSAGSLGTGSGANVGLVPRGLPTKPPKLGQVAPGET